MYNLSSMLESILDKLDIKKFNELEAVKRAASDMDSLNSSGTWKETNKCRSRGGLLDSVPEEEGARGSGGEAQGSEPEDEEEDLGVFGSDNIRAALSQMNYQVAYVAYGVCAPIFYIISWTNGYI